MGTIIHLPAEGKGLYAWATEVGHRHRGIYRVLFSDEYENIFYRDVETGRWVEEDLGHTALAQQVGHRIAWKMGNPIHVPKLLNWHRSERDGKEFSFGFTWLIKDGCKLYEIYNEGRKYLYSLVESREGDWQITGNPDIMTGNIDKDFLTGVIEALPSYMEDKA